MGTGASAEGGGRAPAAWSADAAVLAVAVAWGASYPVAKDALAFAPALALILWRFAIGAVLMGAASRRELRGAGRPALLRGAALGLLLAAVFLAETYGVAATGAADAAFIISLATLLTPVLDSGLAGARPPGRVLAGAATAVAGVALLAGGPGAFGAGEALMGLAALLRAVTVVATKRLTGTLALSSAALTAVQAAVVAGVASGALLASGAAVALPASPRFWAEALFLSLVCTVGAFYVQNAAVRRTSPTRVALLMGTEPLFAALVAGGLYGAPLSAGSAAGGVLVLAGTALGLAGARGPRPVSRSRAAGLWLAADPPPTREDP